MWQTEGRFITDRRREAIWSVWTDVGGWHRWAQDIVWAKLDGPFAADTRGRIRYRGFPSIGFIVRSADPMRSYVTEVPLVLAVLAFDHRIVDAPDGKLELVEVISLRGPLATLLGRLQGRRIRRAWPIAMERMVALATTRHGERIADRGLPPDGEAPSA